MEKYDIYKDIAKRTAGDIYIGVVGPVRTGKSTFISKFMEKLVLPNISNKLYKQIATDEMPQSADGKTIMTSQPKFVPANAVKIELKNKAYANVRLIDCVGYFVEGAIGHEEDGKPRLVKTPWSDEEIPLVKAAEIGTRKVIEEYSTIGILLTTDGSFTDIDRSNYILAEEKVVAELKAIGKPFVIVINCKDKNSPSALLLKEQLEEKYGASAVLVNATEMEKEDLYEIIEKVLLEFPTYAFNIDLPKWMQALPEDDEVIVDLISRVRSATKSVKKMKDCSLFKDAFNSSEKIFKPEISSINLGDGTASFSLPVDNSLFYEVLSRECGDEISGDYELISYVKELSIAKKEYRKIKDALNSANETGYGIVEPDESSLTLDKPVLTKQGGKYGVKFKANAKSLHILKVDLSAEVSPIVGSEEQGEELVNKLVNEYEEDPNKILSTNIFGKTLNSLIDDGLKKKADNISAPAKEKMRKTVNRIVNESKGGVICILL